MAAKIDQEFLKKHHFWVLQGVMGIGLVLAWIGLLINVPEAIDVKAKENEKGKKDVESAKAQPRATLNLYNDRKQELFQLRSKRWKDMWEIQQNMYEWPAVLGEDQLAKTTSLKFGDEISNGQLLDAFKTQYAKEYDVVAKAAAPLQFNGGWRSVLRYVAQWRLVPESEEVWLALEDLWVQKELVSTIARINEDAAKFIPLNPNEDPSKIRARSFRNRTWGVDLEIAEEKGGYALKGKIRNMTDRLQAYGANNELVLKVWLSDDPNAKPFEFAIEGSSLNGGTTADIKYLEKRHKIFEGRVTGIYRVEQVYDARTLPVKRVDKVALGYTSARHSLAELEMTPFSTKASTAETEAAAAGGGAATGGVGGKAEGEGGGGGYGGAAAGGAKDTTPNMLVRSRYVHRTDQVRSMPIGLALICDQTFSADVLTALANSRLRMQIVQSHMNRFRGTINYVADSTSPGVAPSPGGFRGPRDDGDDGPSPGLPPAMGSGGFKGGPPGPGAGVGFPGPMGSFPGAMPGSPGMMMGGFPGSSGASPRSSSEDMVAGNLIELSVYGIASLYEKYQSPEEAAAPKDGGEASGAKTPEAPKEPVGNPVEPVNPDPKEPGVDPKEAGPAPKEATPKEPAPKEAVPAPKEAGPAPKEAAPVPPKS